MLIGYDPVDTPTLTALADIVRSAKPSRVWVDRRAYLALKWDYALITGHWALPHEELRVRGVPILQRVRKA